MYKRIVKLIVYGFLSYAVSSCTLGCANPNKDLLLLMQQKSLSETIRNWNSENKCSVRRLSCPELESLYRKCSPVQNLDDTDFISDAFGR